MLRVCRTGVPPVRHSERTHTANFRAAFTITPKGIGCKVQLPNAIRMIEIELLFDWARLAAFEESLGKLGRIERLQRIGALAQADKFDRDAELIDDADEHAALGCRVQLRDDNPGQLRGFVKEPR